MKTLVLGVVAVGLLSTGAAWAQRYDDSRYADDDRDGDVIYDQARVLRVDPVIVRDRAPPAQRCYDRAASDADGDYGDGRQGGGTTTATDGGRSLATVVGGVAGAVIGSRFGGGSGRLLGTAAGTLAGGVAGRSVYDANHAPARQGTVRVCEPADDRDDRDLERVDGYDITYEYAGRTFHTHRDYNPGDHLRVRVAVQPDER